MFQENSNSSLRSAIIVDDEIPPPGLPGLPIAKKMKLLDETGRVIACLWFQSA